MTQREKLMSAATARDYRYISSKETAQIVRKHLKAKFPGTSFSVRKGYAASGVDVTVKFRRDHNPELWDEINAALAGFDGTGFDGMIDMSYYIESWLLPDGSAVPARSSGTTGSRGVYEPFDHPAPVEGAERVQFSGSVRLSHDWRNMND